MSLQRLREPIFVREKVATSDLTSDPSIVFLGSNQNNIMVNAILAGINTTLRGPNNDTECCYFINSVDIID